MENLNNKQLYKLTDEEINELKLNQVNRQNIIYTYKYVEINRRAQQTYYYKNKEQILERQKELYHIRYNAIKDTEEHKAKIKENNKKYYELRKLRLQEPTQVNEEIKQRYKLKDKIKYDTKYKNNQEFKEKVKDKYNNDAAFREKVITRAKLYYQKKKEKMQEEKEQVDITVEDQKKILRKEKYKLYKDDPEYKEKNRLRSKLYYQQKKDKLKLQVV